MRIGRDTGFLMLFDDYMMKAFAFAKDFDWRLIDLKRRRIVLT